MGNVKDAYNTHKETDSNYSVTKSTRESNSKQ